MAVFLSAFLLKVESIGYMKTNDLHDSFFAVVVAAVVGFLRLFLLFRIMWNRMKRNIERIEKKKNIIYIHELTIAWFKICSDVVLRRYEYVCRSGRFFNRAAYLFFFFFLLLPIVVVPLADEKLPWNLYALEVCDSIYLFSTIYFAMGRMISKLLGCVFCFFFVFFPFCIAVCMIASKSKQCSHIAHNFIGSWAQIC